MSAASRLSDDLDLRIADRLKTLRLERGWSLAALAMRSGVSRATLSRLEHADVSGTAAVLGKLCAVYGITLSRLMRLVEDDFPALVRRPDQEVWTDASVGFERRMISPPAGTLQGEAMEGALGPDAEIVYDHAPRPGLEHHLIMLDGRLTVTVEGRAHELFGGDCLRFQLHGASAFRTPADIGARYILFLV